MCSLLRIGPWKDGAGLAAYGVLLRKTSGCCHPAGYLGTHAAIAVATTCAGRLPQRRSRLFRAFFQATKDHFARGSLMDGGHNRIDALVDHPVRAIHHDHCAVIQVGHAMVRFLAFTKYKTRMGSPGSTAGLSACAS